MWVTHGIKHVSLMCHKGLHYQQGLTELFFWCLLFYPWLLVLQKEGQCSTIPMHYSNIFFLLSGSLLKEERGPGRVFERMLVQQSHRPFGTENSLSGSPWCVRETDKQYQKAKEALRALSSYLIWLFLALKLCNLRKWFSDSMSQTWYNNRDGQTQCE